MKYGLLFLIIISSVLSGCKAKQKTINTTITSETVIVKGTTLGKVSHQYQATGCSTVVIVNPDIADKKITLIPRDKLSSEFDIDGLELYFNYRVLKMPNPAGCSVGIPAELKDISKK